MDLEAPVDAGCGSPAQSGRRKVAQCALCLNVAPLCDSHIIPELLYKPMYDEKHRMVGINAVKDRGPNFIRKGFREPLLCEVCEGRLQKFEHYAAPVLRGLPDLSRRPVGDVVRIPDIDYGRFKLFEMSILWRMGVSKLSFFSDVRLGPEHLETLRTRILAEDPGAPEDYGCLLIRPHGGGDVDQFLIRPRPHRVESHRAYLIVMGGFIWVFFVSGHARELERRAGFVTTNGLVVLISSESAQDFVKNTGRSIRQAGYQVDGRRVNVP